MATDSPKYRAAESKLPQELRAVYREMVRQYEFLTHVRYGRGYVAYEVLAEMVLAGWRLSGDVHPLSRLMTEDGGKS